MTENDVKNQLDDVQEQIYIISGVAGGLCVILIIAVIIIAVILTKLRQTVRSISRGGANTDDLSKRGFSAYTGKTENSEPLQTIAVAPPVQQQQQQSFSPALPNPRRQEGFTYDNNGYNDQQRLRPTNPTGNVGHGHNVHGVQVLPKNPPPPRGNQQTDGFY